MTKELDSGLVVYGASSVGGCSTALYYDRLGVTGEAAPEAIQRAYNEGNENEARIIDMLEHQRVWKVVPDDELLGMGYEFGGYDEDRGVDYSRQVRAGKRVGAKCVVQAHLDGVARMWAAPPMWANRRGELRVVEVKAFGDAWWDKFQSNKSDVTLGWNRGYAWQVSVQMHATGLPLMFVVGHKGSDGKCFEIDVLYVDKPPVGWGTIAAKVLRVEKAVAEGKAPSCELPLMYPCPFWMLHEKDEVEQIDGGDLAGGLLDSLCEQYLVWSKAESEAKRKKKDVGTALMELVDGDSPVSGREYVLGVGKSVWGGGLDEGRMVEDGIDVEGYRLPKNETLYPKPKKIGGG